jgi:hypothetical protein
LQAFPVDLFVAAVVAGGDELEAEETWSVDEPTEDAEVAEVGTALEEEAMAADDEADAAMTLADVDVCALLLSTTKVGWALATPSELITAARVVAETRELLSTASFGRAGATAAKRSVWAPCMKPYSAFYSSPENNRSGHG